MRSHQLHIKVFSARELLMLRNLNELVSYLKLCALLSQPLADESYEVFHWSILIRQYIYHHFIHV